MNEFRRDIEGLRALAVVLVVLFHAGCPGFTGGFIGVDVFFVISGYLITSLLYRELEESGTIHVRAFLARRVRRLLPAASVVLLTTLLLGAVVLPPLEMTRAAASARAAAAYFSNVHFLNLASDYFSGDVRSDPLLHTWSLAVEEQFYAVWPWLLLIGWSVVRGRVSTRRGLGWLLGGVTCASFALACYYTDRRPSTAFYSTPLRAWEFAIGGVAWLATPLIASFEGRRLSALATTIAAWFGFALVVIAAATYSPATEFPGFSAAMPVIGAVLLLMTGNAKQSEAVPSISRILSVSPAQWIGKRSYSWYLWHWPLLTLGLALIPTIGLLPKLILLLAALALAHATYRAVETPARRNAKARPRVHQTLLAGLATTATLVALSTLGVHLALDASRSPAQVAFSAAAQDAPSTYRDGCVNSTTDDAVQVCEYGAASDTVVALFGDSHAVQWFPAARSIANARHWRLLVLAKTRCATADVRVYDLDTGRRFLECERWRQAAIDTLKRRRPTLVLLSNATRYVNGNHGISDRRTVTVAEWEAGLARRIRDLRNAGIASALITDTPLFAANVPVCLARSGWLRRFVNQCDAKRSDALRGDIRAAEVRAAASVPGTKIIDLANVLCTETSCPARIGGRVAYADREHLTGTMAETLAPRFASALDETSP